MFIKNDVPCDAVWLDIEYADEKRYLTWDFKAFPEPRKMLDKISKEGRRLVTIVDPHVKHDPKYYIYKETKARGILVSNKNNEIYHGKCWPGQSAWIDYMNPASASFLLMLYMKNEELKEHLAFDEANYLWHDSNLGIWIDMNEPACFELTDKTMPKSNKHQVSVLSALGPHTVSVEHRDVHNLYGFFSSQRTFKALSQRSNERPFILSRSFYPGTQQHAAIWSGDAGSDWTNFKKCVPILLQKAICGINFVGADVPGFHGDPLLEYH